jgi:hypothetical protein
MDQDDTIELTEVVAHDPSGRVKKFIRSKISRNEAVSLRAAARAKDEEVTGAELLKDVDRIVERARQPSPTHAQLLEKARMPAPQPTPQPTPQPSPGPVVDRRSHHERSSELREFTRLLAAIHRDQARDRAKDIAWRERIAAQRKEIDEIVAARAAAQTAVNADYSGREVGRVFMASLIDKTPSGCRVLNVDKILDEPMRNALKQLQDQNYDCSDRPEFAPAFEKAFWQGAHEAIDEFNQRNGATAS